MGNTRKPVRIKSVRFLGGGHLSIQRLRSASCLLRAFLRLSKSFLSFRSANLQESGSEGLRLCRAGLSLAKDNPARERGGRFSFKKANRLSWRPALDKPRRRTESRPRLS